MFSVTNLTDISLGITFTLLPPVIFDSWTSSNFFNISIANFIGFPLVSSPIFPPEWPPLKLSYTNSKPGLAVFSLVKFTFPFHSLHSAELIKIFPSFPLSNEIILLLSMLAKSKFIAPNIVVSSSEVKIHSNLGAFIFSQSNTANIIATPIPLSAPSVVPLAFIKSPSTYNSRPSLEKSWLLSGSFSQIISVCACNAMAGLFSLPGVAFFFIIIFL